MSNTTLKKTLLRVFSFPGNSIQQRLPFLIFILLLIVIVAFSSVSYVGVKKASLSVGRVRLTTLTGQLSAIFQQSFISLTDSAQKTAGQEAIKKYLRSGDEVSRREALEILQKLPVQDNLYMLTQLLDSQKHTVLSTGKDGFQIHVNNDSVIPPPSVKKQFAGIGKIFFERDSMFYPVIAPVTDNNKTTGYIVRWRLLRSTKKGVEQFSQLLGANGTLYFGNDDGQFWTDLVKPVSKPPVEMSKLLNMAEYSRRQGDPLIASAKPLPNSRWLVLVEFSKTAFLEASNLFLRWVIIIGFILVAAGSVGAWLMSRNITTPLKKLTDAAETIAGGDYSLLVDIDRKDELGKLAEAFNIMAIQVRNAQYDLEKKVKDRTVELETANKELETFSYSVSHDLHAPLRIIDGYVSMLAEKASVRLHAEDTRLLENIQNRTRKMRKLIDDLLNLSYLGRKQLALELVDMDAMVKVVVHEQRMLGEKQFEIKYGILEPAVCDSALIRQVWSNLISNAIKYSGKKKDACIEIGSYKNDSEIVYFAKDNGAGFDMQYAAKLFGVFERLHGEQEFEGTGIGLSLVQRVINRHGGRVWAEGEVDKGATFYFSLPAE